MSDLLCTFRQLEGRTLVRAVDCYDCVELVFNGEERNLVTIWPTGSAHFPRGQIAFGFIAPELIEAGYGLVDREEVE